MANNDLNVNQNTGEIEAFQMPKEEMERTISFAEIEAEANAQGLTSADYTVVLNPYETLNQDKDALLERPFWIRAVKFMEDKTTHAKYVNMWVVRDDDAMFRVTDGSTGIYTQIERLVTERLNSDHPTPYNYFRIANGLRKSEYGVLKDGTAVDLGTEGIVSTAATYYLA